MNAWHEDLLNLLVTPITCPEHIFGSIERVAVKLGFDHVAYGFQAPYPLTQPKITMLNNYPGPWQEHYSRTGYLFTDPTVIHGRQSQDPLIWNDQAFVSNPKLWRDAQDHGIRAGWAQSSIARTKLLLIAFKAFLQHSSALFLFVAPLFANFKRGQ